MNQTLKTVILFLTLVLIVSSCSSRYRLDLFATVDESREKVKVESTEFIHNAEIGNFMADRKIIEGHGNVAIITTARRGQNSKIGLDYAFTFDKIIRFRIYLELPTVVEKGVIDLEGHSCAQLMGHFEQTEIQKLFKPESGVAIVDSVTSKFIYTSIDGKYKNSDGRQTDFEGKFKIKIRD